MCSPFDVLLIKVDLTVNIKEETKFMFKHLIIRKGDVKMKKLFLISMLNLFVFCSAGYAELIDNGDGTVTDTKTGLMWASIDNGENITWPKAHAYCQNYNGGGYTDWRLPTPDELTTLHDTKETGKYKITPKIKLTACCPWGSETRDSKAVFVEFSSASGLQYSTYQSDSHVFRALPVRDNK